MDVLTERTANILLDDDDDYNDDEKGAVASVPLRRFSVAKQQSSRRRRRSSARFLKLSQPNGDDEEDDALPPPSENLGEVYQNAIRMNAENRINASNSWNLNLIDHMDRFLMPSAGSAAMEDTLGPVTGVNFTKASCTLDASVKIYSYRVDDVHLTSYKVLANLNRTETNKKSNKDDNDGEEAGARGSSERGTAAGERRAAARNNNAETLETNLANINIHKLDAAFDIDPLFHKMSKTFDEGGAKGLLLANLGVSETGCNIVFDSTLDNDTEEDEAKTGVETEEPSNTMIDVSSLVARLEASLNGQAVHQLPLVPQLAPLRAEFAQLNEEGFVEKVKPSNRYAAPKEEEAEAERSIHVEAIERSRASQADLGRSLMAEQADDSSADDDDGGGFAPVDFGGGDDDDDDDFNDNAFPVSFVHDGDHRYSSDSFQTTFEASRPPSQATVLLDAIAAGEISGSQSNYEYFNKKALETIQGNNQWAGAAHWKKMQPKRKPKAVLSDNKADAAPSTKKRKGRTTAKAGNNAIAQLLLAVDTSKPTPDIKELLKKPPKGKKGSEPLQMTKAAIAKAAKNENLLPMDAGIQVENFTSLFLRPNTNVLAFQPAAAPTRQVGFGGVETWGNGGGDDQSYGDDNDDGFGFAFGGDDDGDDVGDFVVPELEGVRKVEKVSVGYATVAKKVDVKRLKKDLWDELERTLKARRQSLAADEEKGELMDEDDEKSLDPEPSTISPTTTEADQDAPPPLLSFQDTVREMQTTQSQADVTLSFYFICVLHLANEKGLELESLGLEDFTIRSS